ncbi:MAG: hypothetical protein HZC41_25765 [Chloroflexi bacterium]|nr:hypothetical protein [Chloroflexota bacterium]
MTFVMYAPSAIGGPKVEIVRILGKLFTPVDRTAVAVGALLHFVMGGVFAVSYVSLWHMGVGSVNRHWGLIFGGIHGLIAAVLMNFLLMAHPRRPQRWTSANAAVYVLSHLAFGSLVAAFYKAIRPTGDQQ